MQGRAPDTEERGLLSDRSSLPDPPEPTAPAPASLPGPSVLLASIGW